MYAPVALSRKAEIEAAIRHIQEMVGPDIVRIRYEIDRDWSGDWGIFFRVILKDDAARDRLQIIVETVMREFNRQLDFEALQVFPYQTFRSESEQAELREPAWA
ncbi:hypothetical protein F183_A06350 [Bryobacterales bacterium F-183]|nr:hypothetical protein F183_A06350 [Bryobacterales bacterium F-183]